MKKYLTYGLSACLLICAACMNTTRRDQEPPLAEELYRLADSAHGTVGIAFVSDNDTVTVNNGVRYPMMSVFKLHQSLAVADALDRRGAGPDSVLSISVSELDPDTWSPMLEKYGVRDLQVSIGELMKYALISSDNNASNLLFSHIVSPEETDTFIKSIAADTTFSIRYSEADMRLDHARSYLNHSSPLSAALLIRQVFTSEITNRQTQDSIKSALTAVTTGQDRLGAATADLPGVLFAHKTGSGYRNNAGELTAHNDIGYFRLPDGRDYSLAVFIRDFDGTEQEASAVIAEISRLVYDHFTKTR